MLHVRGEELLMANPFSAVPTAYRVRAGGRSWYANCAWDAFGICAALDSNGVIDTRCPDCGESMTSPSRTAGRTTSSSSSTASFPPPRGGTTSASPEGR